MFREISDFAPAKLQSTNFANTDYLQSQQNIAEKCFFRQNSALLSTWLGRKNNTFGRKPGLKGEILLISMKFRRFRGTISQNLFSQNLNRFRDTENVSEEY